MFLSVSVLIFLLLVPLITRFIPEVKALMHEKEIYDDGSF